MQNEEHDNGTLRTSYAYADGHAYRRTTIDGSAWLVQVWSPGDGGWVPMRRTVRTSTTTAERLGEETTTTVFAYPPDVVRLLASPSAWSPTLPATVEVDILRAQLGNARRELRLTEEQLTDARAFGARMSGSWEASQAVVRDAKTRAKRIADECVRVANAFYEAQEALLKAKRAKSEAGLTKALNDASVALVVGRIPNNAAHLLALEIDRAGE